MIDLHTIQHVLGFCGDHQVHLNLLDAFFIFWGAQIDSYGIWVWVKQKLLSSSYLRHSHDNCSHANSDTID